MSKSMAAEKKEKQDKLKAIQLAKLQESMTGRFIGMLDYLAVESLYKTILFNGRDLLNVAREIQRVGILLHVGI